MANKIQFIHFYGSKTDWDHNINQNIWKNSIVFGQIKDEETSKLEYKIYAGRVVTDSSTIDYIYNIFDISGGFSNAHINVSTCNPEDAGLTPEHGDYFVKEEYLSYINSETGKPALPNEPNAIINKRVEPRRTAYIFDSSLKDGEGDWVALDGNVNAENVYFPLGFQRTKEWGTAKAKDSTDSDKEIIGKNLKEVFEYYLVEEIFKGNAVPATLTISTWTINSSGGKATPNDLYKYIQLDGTTMTTNSSLVKVGTTIKVNKIDVSTTPKHTGPEEITNGTAAKVENMIKYSEDGKTIINESSSTGTKPYVHFEYSTNFDEATATLELKSSNNNIISSSSNTGRINSSVMINEITTTLPEGKFLMTLSYSNNVSASRIIDNSIVATTVSVYPVSNKDNVSTGKLKANGLVPQNSYNRASNSITKNDTTVTINAVYPIYTNGTKNADQASGMNDRNTNCLWSDNNNYHGQETNSGKYTEWSLINFNSPKTIYVNVNDFGPEHPNDKPIIFIPSNLQLKIETRDQTQADGKKKIPAAGFDGTGKINGYEAGSLKFNDPSVVILDGTNYDMYKIADECQSGQTSLKLELIKK